MGNYNSLANPYQKLSAQNMFQQNYNKTTNILWTKTHTDYCQETSENQLPRIVYDYTSHKYTNMN